MHMHMRMLAPKPGNGPALAKLLNNATSALPPAMLHAKQKVPIIGALFYILHLLQQDSCCHVSELELAHAIY